MIAKCPITVVNDTATFKGRVKSHFLTHWLLTYFIILLNYTAFIIMICSTLNWCILQRLQYAGLSIDPDCAGTTIDNCYNVLKMGYILALVFALNFSLYFVDV